MLWRKRLLMWGLPLVLIGVGVFVGYKLLHKAKKATSFTQVVAASRGNLTAALTLTGQVLAERQAELVFDVSRLPLTELVVTPGQLVKKGDALARIDPASLQRAVDQAQANFVTAEEALTEAKSSATDLELRKAELDVAQAQVALEEANQAVVQLEDQSTAAASDALRKAQYNVESARLSLATTQHSSTVGKTVRDLEYTVQWHERKLRDLQTNKADSATLAVESTALDKARIQLDAARAGASSSLRDAQDKLTAAEDALVELQGGAGAVSLAQAKNKAAQAEYNLSVVQQALADLKAGPDAKTVKTAQTKYDAAKAALDNAKAALVGATMVAPFDGTVISVGAEVGDLVSSGTKVVILADLTDLQIEATIDETDISQVQAGQEATITFDAISGKRFKGKVLEVPLEGTVTQNVVTYAVRMSLEGIEGVTLKSGMTANIRLVVGQATNALLVPALAVRQGESGNVVLAETEAGGAQIEVPVQVGLTDGTNTEILGGLLEGDRVVVEYSSAGQQQNQMMFGLSSAMPGGVISVSGGRPSQGR